MLLMILFHIIYGMNKFVVRKAIADDAYWIVYVNAHTRYTTYKWLMPQKLLETRINTIDERATKVRNAIIEGKEYEGKKADIFSLGVLLLILVIGFQGFTSTSNYKMIKENNIIIKVD